jgi:hypothetical protein
LPRSGETKPAPNTRLQLTPLRGRKIAAFLKASIDLNDISIS